MYYNEYKYFPNAFFESLHSPAPQQSFIAEQVIRFLAQARMHARTHIPYAKSFCACNAEKHTSLTLMKLIKKRNTLFSTNITKLCHIKIYFKQNV
jgi:hypothetical protein